MGHRMPPPPPMRRPKAPPREFNIKAEKRTYEFVREERFWIFQDALQEFIEENPDYELVENPPFKLPGEYFTAVFKLKDSKIKSKTTIKE